jgi:transposase
MPASSDCPAPQVPASTLPAGEFAALIGLDWGDKEHAIALRPRQAGAPIENLVLEHSAENLHDWLSKLAERFNHQRVAVAIESSKGAVVAALMEHPWLVIYPIHPSTSRRFSTAFTPSRAKNDMPDAIALLEILENHRHRLRMLIGQDPETRRVTMLVEARRKLVDRRTMLTNGITSLLKNYYPQALKMVGKTLYAPLALDFLQRWPELAVLQRTKPSTLRSFYTQHRVRSAEIIEERLEVLAKARPLTEDRVLCEVSVLQLQALVAEIRVLNTQVANLEKAIASAFASHPDADLFKSLPGAGEAMAPRLCALFGMERNRWSDAAELQKYYGIAPVIERSGKKRFVHWRWSAPLFARQTLVEWAGLSVTSCRWAKAFYLQQEQRQKGRSAILRALAFKWLRILWRLWKNREPYDDARYLKQLQEKKAPFLAFLPAE